MDLSNSLKGLVDSYDRPARLYPGLLGLMPFAVTVVCLYGSRHPWISGLISVLSFCGVGYLLGRVSRDAGKRLQERLFAEWGGAPTTQLLRFRDPTLDRITKERYHTILGKGLGHPLPTIAEEGADAAAADEVYRAATTWLIEQTRDSRKFPLIFKENIAYGFQRNSLGIRRYGATVAVMSLAWIFIHARVLLWKAPYVSAASLGRLDAAEIVALLVSAVILFVWLVFVTEDALRRTAFAYGERLLQACDHLGPTGGKTRPGSRNGTRKAQGS